MFSPTEVFRIVKPVTNTLAYLANAIITVVKSYWVLGPGKVDFLTGETVVGAMTLMQTNELRMTSSEKGHFHCVKYHKTFYSRNLQTFDRLSLPS